MISAIILAGGRGNKFFPYSTIRNKVCFPILGVPAIRRLTTQITEAGIKNVLVVVGYREQSVKNALKGIKEVVFIEINVEEDIATAIRKAISLVETENLLIIYGDIVTSERNIKKLINSHISSKAEISILASENSPEPIHSLRVQASFNEFDYFDYDGKSHLWFCNALIGKKSIIEPAAYEEIGCPRNVPVGAMPYPQGSLITIIDAIRDSKVPIAIVHCSDFIIDLTHPWDALRANQEALLNLFNSLEENRIHNTAKISDGADIATDGKIVVCEDAVIGKGCIVKGNLYVGRGSQINIGAIVSENVFLCENATITEYAKLHPYTIVGNSNLIGFSAEFYGLTLDNVFMMHNCCISGILGRNVDVGAGTISATWRFDNKVKEMDCEGRKEVPPYHGNLSYVGDFCRTGVGVLLMPGVRIGSYSCLGPGTIIKDDIPTNSIILSKQKQNIQRWGPEKYNNY